MTTENLTNETNQWRTHLVDNGAGIARILDGMRRIAVVGIKPEEVGGAAHDIPAILQEMGYDIIPVPVYYPEVTEMLGKPVHRSLTTIDPPPDMALMFRRSHDIPKHEEELLAVKPKVVWMQSGIRNAEVAEKLAKAGVDVVQDRCIKVELLFRGR